MIVRPKPRVLELFTILRLSILPRIAPQIAAVAAFSVGVLWLENRYPQPFKGWSVAPFTLLGIALSIFSGFRNNACYDRWWEARRQLGAMIAEMRSFARVLVTLPGGDRARRERVVMLTANYAQALMAHLRGKEMPLYDGARNVPDAMLREISREYGAMLTEGEFGEQVYRTLDDHVSAMVGIQAACERIRTTPTPFTYTLLLHRTAYAFCFLLPFSLVSALGYATPLFAALVAFSFFGLDTLGDDLEEPFGEAMNALPLDALARTMEISLMEALGREAPQPLLPVDEILR